MTNFYMSDADTDAFFNENSVDVNDCISTYIDQGYNINHNLRKNANIQKSEHCNTIKELNSRCKTKTVKVPGNFYLYRGIPNAMQYFIQNNMRDKGFCSTTKSFDIAEKFMQSNSENESCCILHIHLSKDASYKMIPIKYAQSTSYNHEREIIFPRNTKLKVIEDEELLNNIVTAVENYKQLCENCSYNDLYSPNNSKVIKFPFKVIINKKNQYIIPVEVII